MKLYGHETNLTVDFSGYFDEEITVKTSTTTANVIIMQGNLMHNSRIAIVK